MRIVGIIAGLLGLVVVVILVVGWRLPVKHRATRQATFAVPAETLFTLVNDVAEFPSWRSDVQRVELLPNEDGHERFREIGSNGAILYRVEERVPNARLVTRIADGSLPFGGTWTHELLPSAGGGTTLRITEDGEIYNPLFRFISRFVIGYTSSMDRYLADVRRRTGRSLVGPPGQR
jgi:uncharacterized protein YndB with AHSA1/START domain